MIYVLDKFDKLVTVLDTDQTISNGVQVLSAMSKEVNGGASTIEVTIDSSHKDSGLISDSENQSLLFKNSEGNWEQFFIFDIEDNHEATMTKTMLGESISQELDNRFCVEDLPVLDGSPQALISFCLKPSRWILGECDIVDNKIHQLDTKNRSVSELLQDCAKIYSSDFRFRIVVDPDQPSKILDRIVDFKKSLVTDKGKIFSIGKDIVSVKRTVDSSNVKTAILPVVVAEGSEGEEGESTLTIKDVVWETSKGHPTDKPKGQEWVGNNNTLQQWGYYNKIEQTMNHRFMKAEFNEAKTPEELIAQAWNVLNMNSVPKVTYEVNVVDLYRLSKDTNLQHEHVKIGEKVRIVDKEFNPPMIVEAHIVEIERDLMNPTNDLVVIGNPRNTIADSFTTIQTQLNDKLSIKDLGQTIIQLKENTYYVENDRKIEAGSDGKDLLFVNMVLTDSTEVMLHFSSCIYSEQQTLVTFEMSNNGSVFPFKPRHTMNVGFNVVSFNLPMFELETMIENKFFIKMYSETGTVVAEPKQANMVIKGSKVLISEKAPPFTRGEHYETVDFIVESVFTTKLKATTTPRCQNPVYLLDILSTKETVDFVVEETINPTLKGES